MNIKNSDTIKSYVRDRYGDIVKSKGNISCCGPSSSCCQTEIRDIEKNAISKFISYSEKDLAGVPEGTLISLGCGNPTAIAKIQTGETIIDLGCGGGIDCFIASKMVGENGLVIGVDMTSAMLQSARETAKGTECENIEFRLGEIENLPVADNTADVIISNCVINLSPDKTKVYKEAFRVLKKGGRLSISDMVAIKPIPEDLVNDLRLFASCISGAAYIDDLKAIMSEAGFTDIKIKVKDIGEQAKNDCSKGTKLEGIVKSATIEAYK